MKLEVKYSETKLFEKLSRVGEREGNPILGYRYTDPCEIINESRLALQSLHKRSLII